LGNYPTLRDGSLDTLLGPQALIRL